MPLPLTVSGFSKIQIGFTFLVPAHLGSPGKGPLNGCVYVCFDAVYLYFPVLFCLSVSVKWLAVKIASEMTYTVSSGALNSTPSIHPLMLLVVRQEERPACKNWVMRCWCGYLSGARCRLFACGPDDATVISKPRHLLPLLNLGWRLILPFWYQLTQLVLEKRLLYGVVVVVVVV